MPELGVAFKEMPSAVFPVTLPVAEIVAKTKPVASSVIVPAPRSVVNDTASAFAEEAGLKQSRVAASRAEIRILMMFRLPKRGELAIRMIFNKKEEANLGWLTVT